MTGPRKDDEDLLALWKEGEAMIPLEASLYVMELPSDVDVTKGFSALSGLTAKTND